MNLFQEVMKSSLTGAIVGGLLVHFLTKSRDQRKWFLDRRLDEYRELLQAISTAHNAVDTLVRPGKRLSPEDETVIVNAISSATKTFSDRIFIASFLEKENLMQRWKNATRWNMGHLATADLFKSSYKEIHAVILGEARKGFPKHFL